MLIEENYRFCVKAALQVMQEQRQKLYEDCMQYEPTIYNGLHTSNSDSVRRLYFQMYFVDWLNQHWENMTEIFNRHPEYITIQKQEMTLFFAEYFSKFISECSKKGLMSKLAIPELLKVQKSQLKEMILSSDKWEQNSNRLRVQMKKNKEQYINLVKEMEEHSQ